MTPPLPFWWIDNHLLQSAPAALIRGKGERERGEGGRRGKGEEGKERRKRGEKGEVRYDLSKNAEGPDANCI